MLYSPSPTRIVSTHQSESSPGYSDIHPIEDDPERRFYRELEDRSDDEMDGGGGDEYYTPTQSPRESNDSEIDHVKKSRGSPKKINAEFRAERARSKPYWEKRYQIRIPEEVWTKELRKFMKRFLFLRRFLMEKNSHGSSPSGKNASKRFRDLGESTVVGSFKKYRLTGKLLECFIEFNKKNDNERFTGLYAVPVNKVFEELLQHVVEHSNDMRIGEQPGDGRLLVDQLDDKIADKNAATMAFRTALSSIGIYPGLYMRMTNYRPNERIYVDCPHLGRMREVVPDPCYTSHTMQWALLAKVFEQVLGANFHWTIHIWTICLGTIEFEWERKLVQEEGCNGFKASADSFVYPPDTIRDIAAHIQETYGEDHFLTHQSLVMSEIHKTCHDRLQTLPWFTKYGVRGEYGCPMDFFEAYEKNRDGKRFLHIHIRIHDGKVEKKVVHDLLKSELVHDPSLQQVAVLDSFTVRCSASYESDIFSNPFQDTDFSRFGWSLSHAFKAYNISKQAAAA